MEPRRDCRAALLLRGGEADRRRRSDEPATFGFGVPAPDTQRLVDSQRIGEALRRYGTARADAFGELLAFDAHVCTLKHGRRKEQVSRVTATRSTVSPRHGQVGRSAHAGPT